MTLVASALAVAGLMVVASIAVADVSQAQVVPVTASLDRDTIDFDDTFTLTVTIVGETNVPLRGVQPASFLIQGGDLRIVEGRNFIPGSDEVIVGEPLVERIRNCRVGDVLTLNTTPFKVVGVFAGKGGYASEIWGDTDRMMTALERLNLAFSSATACSSLRTRRKAGR